MSIQKPFYRTTLPLPAAPRIFRGPGRPAWHRVIGWFYNGRLLTLFKVGEYVRGTLPGRLLDFHFRKHMPRIFTGEDATNRYSLGLVEFMVKYGLAGNDPSKVQID